MLTNRTNSSVPRNQERAFWAGKHVDNVTIILLQDRNATVCFSVSWSVSHFSYKASSNLHTFHQKSLFNTSFILWYFRSEDFAKYNSWKEVNETCLPERDFIPNNCSSVPVAIALRKRVIDSSWCQKQFIRSKDGRLVVCYALRPHTHRASVKK